MLREYVFTSLKETTKVKATETQVVDLPTATFYGFCQSIYDGLSRIWILELR